MKAILQKDRRSKIDSRFDDLWNKLCRDANLSARQSMIVARYLREIMGMRIHEIESAKDMGWLISLIESEHFGTDIKRGATRLLRVQQKCADVCNEAYAHDCIDANGFWQKYDGCGIEHLQQRLAKYGVEYDTAL
jgi:hypothetical protein